jgi:hypothetical protein
LSTTRRTAYMAGKRMRVTLGDEVGIAELFEDKAP